MDQFQTPWYLGRNGPVSDTMLSGGMDQFQITWYLVWNVSVSDTMVSGGMDQFQTSWCLVWNGPVSGTMVSGGMDQFQMYGIWWNGSVSDTMVPSVERTSFRHHGIWWNGPVSDIMVSSAEWTSFRHHGVWLNGPISGVWYLVEWTSFRMHGIWWNRPVSDTMVSDGMDQFQIPCYLMEWTISDITVSSGWLFCTCSWTFHLLKYGKYSKKLTFAMIYRSRARRYRLYHLCTEIQYLALRLPLKEPSLVLWRRVTWWTTKMFPTYQSITLQDHGSEGPICVQSFWKIFPTRPAWPWDPPSLLNNEYRIFPGGKAAEAWRWQPTLSSAEVKERVEIYVYSTSVLSWQVIG